jgi:hypothetical protein
MSCVDGPEGCDPQGGELVRCAVCDEPVCDFHGDYDGDGDWCCAGHREDVAA